VTEPGTASSLGRAPGGTSRVLVGAVTAVIGAGIALQSRAHGELGQYVGTGLFPAWWSMTSGFVLLTVIVMTRRGLRAGVAVAVRAGRSRVLPWWAFTGGLLGSFFLVSQSVAVPITGVAVFTVGVVAGQVIGSLVADRIGLAGAGRRAVTTRRLAAAGIAVLAVLIGVSDRLGSATSVVAFAVLAVVAGVVTAPQQAFNGRVGLTAGSAFVGAWGSYLGGVLTMSVVLAVGLRGWVHLADAWGAAPWTYAGGALGVAAIVGGAWAVPILGVLVFSLVSLFGQLAGALALDLLVPTPGTSVGWHLFVGVATAGVAVAVAAGRRPPGGRRPQEGSS